jgi:hypothetical protein
MSTSHSFATAHVLLLAGTEPQFRRLLDEVVRPHVAGLLSEASIDNAGVYFRHKRAVNAARTWKTFHEEFSLRAPTEIFDLDCPCFAQD